MQNDEHATGTAGPTPRWEALPLDGHPGQILSVRVTTDWTKEAEARYELHGNRITRLIRVRVERYVTDLFDERTRRYAELAERRPAVEALFAQRHTAAGG